MDAITRSANSSLRPFLIALVAAVLLNLGLRLRIFEHVLRAHRRRISAHQDRSAGDGTDWGVRKGVLEEESLFRKCVDVRGLGLLVAVAANPVGRIVLAGNPEDVRALLC